MKKVLGFLAIVATVMGMSTMVMAKTFSDVKNTKYAEAVDILSDLKVVSGYSDGTYKPGNSVKRSEMAKLLIVAMGKENYAASLEGNTNFNDVSAGHWASGYINLASSLGLIKGYPDGTFRPDATVSYVEASTMLLRALDYGTELDGLSWPTGYMTKANSAGILENVTANSSSDSAIRGNIASMVLNTLKANTRKVVKSNSNGNVYGNGERLIEKTFEDLICVKEGTIIDINFNSNIITVEDTTLERKVKVYYSEDNIKKILGRQVSFIYDDDAEKFMTFEFTDKLTVKEVNVDEITDGILFDDDDEYELPKSSKILFVGTTKYEDVEKAYLTMDANKKVTYALLEGVEKIYAGIVTEKGFKIGDNSAIEVKTTEDEYEELALESSTKVALNEIVLYAYNAKEEIIIRSVTELADGKKVKEKTSSSIQLEGKDKISFTEDEDYFVFLIEDGSIKTGKLSDVTEEFDTGVIIKLNGIHYILIFVESVNPDDIAVDMSVTEAKAELYSVLKVARKKTESKYSVATFETLREALKEAEDLYASEASYSPAKIMLVTRKLNNALNNLKGITEEDEDLRKAYDKLVVTIADAKKVGATDYTESSYSALQKAITAGERIDLKNTTLEKVKIATDAVTAAKKALLTKQADENIRKNKLNKIKEFIDTIKPYTKTKWEEKTSYPTWTAVTQKLRDAETIYNNESQKTTQELTTFAEELDQYIVF